MNLAVFFNVNRRLISGYADSIFRSACHLTVLCVLCDDSMKAITVTETPVGELFQPLKDRLLQPLLLLLTIISHFTFHLPDYDCREESNHVSSSEVSLCVCVTTSETENIDFTHRMKLDDAIVELERIMRLFICNHYKEALAECERLVNHHFYFHVLKSLFQSMNGVVTFQDEFLDEALNTTKTALAAVDKNRRKRSRFSRMIWSPDYDDYTDNECHAEGSYSILAACAAVMTIACEKTLIGLIKTGYWAKTAVNVLR